MTVYLNVGQAIALHDGQNTAAGPEWPRRLRCSDGVQLSSNPPVLPNNPPVL